MSNTPFSGSDRGWITFPSKINHHRIRFRVNWEHFLLMVWVGLFWSSFKYNCCVQIYPNKLNQGRKPIQSRRKQCRFENTLSKMKLGCCWVEVDCCPSAFPHERETTRYYSIMYSILLIILSFVLMIQPSEFQSIKTLKFSNSPDFTLSIRKRTGLFLKESYTPLNLYWDLLHTDWLGARWSKYSLEVELQLGSLSK